MFAKLLDRYLFPIFVILLALVHITAKSQEKYPEQRAAMADGNYLALDRTAEQDFGKVNAHINMDAPATSRNTAIRRGYAAAATACTAGRAMGVTRVIHTLKVEP